MVNTVLFGIVAHIPDLPGAACHGLAPMFDPDHDESAALALCATCSALQPCRAWFDGLAPRHRPEGVVAGAVHHKP
jgi:WhiB family transcriptional regulator, redox-sensing transcriptional regulator